MDSLNVFHSVCLDASVLHHLTHSQALLIKNKIKHLEVAFRCYRPFKCTEVFRTRGGMYFTRANQRPNCSVSCDVIGSQRCPSLSCRRVYIWIWHVVGRPKEGWMWQIVRSCSRSGWRMENHWLLSTLMYVNTCVLRECVYWSVMCERSFELLAYNVLLSWLTRAVLMGLCCCF